MGRGSVGNLCRDSLMEKYLMPLFWSSNDYELMHNMSAVMCVFSFTIFVAFGFLPAPYGRYSSTSIGFRINGRLSWIIQEIPSFAVPFLVYVYTDRVMLAVSYPNKILLSLFLLHYFQRTLIFPWLLQGTKPSPILISLFAFLFCTYNGFLQSYYLINVALYPVSWYNDIRFISGILLFFVGMVINIHSDHVLRNLRKPGETDYKIPYGGAFNYVSGANYFGEIVEWWGFGIACWSFCAISFALFSTLFLGWRACHHHVFYLDKFEDYPKSRKALIPFIL
uniref:3-oxo-5alpha-steroid 4-dehydrogenase (NADP(+)) n=1 Tax=Strigamia maritima TaxID=126957 RepID=T1JHU5_STRMM